MLFRSRSGRIRRREGFCGRRYLTRPHDGRSGLVQTQLLLTQKALTHERGKFGGVAGFAKSAVQALRTRGILYRPIAVIVFSPQPAQECLCDLRHWPTRENDKVTRVLNSEIGQSNKRSLIELRPDHVIPKADPPAFAPILIAPLVQHSRRGTARLRISALISHRRAAVGAGAIRRAIRGWQTDPVRRSPLR